MNTSDVLHYGHQTVLNAIRDFPAGDWETSGACGAWSVKDILAHLASFEQVLVDVLAGFLGDAPTPTLDRFVAEHETFNEAEVIRRRDRTPQAVLAEYEEAHAHAVQLLARIPPEQRRQNGALPWYGPEYDLDDFIVYTFYGHKREHCAQIGVFRDRMARAAHPADADREIA